MQNRVRLADRHMTTAILMAIAVVGCTELDVLQPSPDPLPEDNPGQPMAGIQNVGTLAWNPVSGRLIAPVYVGSRSFAILSVDPQTHAKDTLIGTTSGLLRGLKFAGSTGAMFYSVETDPPGASNPRSMRRVPVGGGTSESVSTPRPVIGEFFVSPEGTHLLFASGANAWTLADLVRGEEIATREASFPRALGAGGNEVVVQYPIAHAVQFSTGGSRELTAIKFLGYLVDAVWIDGGWRVLMVVPPIGEQSTYTAYEWDERLGTTTPLGSVTANPSGTSFCAGWSPSTHSAVIMADSISSSGGFFSYAVHYTIAFLSNGSARTIGSANLNGEFAPPCALSPDGKLFVYSGTREFLGNSLIYMKQTR